MPLFRKPPQPAVPVTMSGRQARKLARNMAAHPELWVSAQPAARPAMGRPGVPGSTLARRSGGFRFRRHLIPFAWLAVLLLAGLGTRTAGIGAGILAGLILAGLMILFSWHAKPFARKACRIAAAETAILVPLLCAFGWTAPWPAMLAVAWGTVTACWVVRYAWRPSVPQPQPEATDYEKWDQLAAEKKWNGHLGMPEMLPGGGRRYQVQLDGIKTTIGNVLNASENVAGAWHKPMTEAFAERSPDGITSRGYLTILGRDTLMRVREWDGTGFSAQTGVAPIGRYADGHTAQVKIYTPRYGTRHALISGTTGSGKSEALNLLIFMALASGFIVPVVLDPQEGQSLPFWKDKLLYARGTGECARMLRGLHAGMMDRSAHLADLDWDDDGTLMHGMGMFDHAITSLPVVLIIFDEAHMVLTGKSKDCRDVVKMTTEIGRLGRKTGVAMWLSTHLPSLNDLGGEQALRDMLRGGNVLGLRTANSVATGMLGLQKDPSQIPLYFLDGKETYGLSYLGGPDNRPDAPMRTDLVPKSMYASPPAAPALDSRFAAAMARAMAAPPAGEEVSRPSLRIVESEPEEDGPEGRTAVDAVLTVLRRNGGEMSRGEILEAAGKLVTGEWGRGKPYRVRSIQNALDALTEDGRTGKIRHGVYRASRVAAGAGSPEAGR